MGNQAGLRFRIVNAGTFEPFLDIHESVEHFVTTRAAPRLEHAARAEVLKLKSTIVDEVGKYGISPLWMETHFFPALLAASSPMAPELRSYITSTMMDWCKTITEAKKANVLLTRGFQLHFRNRLSQFFKYIETNFNVETASALLNFDC